MTLPTDDLAERSQVDETVTLVYMDCAGDTALEVMYAAVAIYVLVVVPASKYLISTVYNVTSSGR